MPRLQIWHLVLLIVAFIVLFGWKNLPNIARSMGESMRVFKSEVDQMKDENSARKERDGAAPPLPEGDDRVRGERDDHYREDRDDRYRDTAQDEYRRAEDRRGDDPRA